MSGTTPEDVNPDDRPMPDPGAREPRGGDPLRDDALGTAPNPAAARTNPDPADAAYDALGPDPLADEESVVEVAPSATPRSTKRALGSIVLGFEAIIMFLATLVAFGLVKDLPGPLILVGGALICLLLVVSAGLLRWRIGFVLGWIMQAVILATALLVPLMVIVGAMFVAMWVYCVIRGGKIDRDRAAGLL